MKMDGSQMRKYLHDAQSIRRTGLVAMKSVVNAMASPSLLNNSSRPFKYLSQSPLSPG